MIIYVKNHLKWEHGSAEFHLLHGDSGSATLPGMSRVEESTKSNVDLKDFLWAHTTSVKNTCYIPTKTVRAFISCSLVAVDHSWREWVLTWQSCNKNYILYSLDLRICFICFKRVSELLLWFCNPMGLHSLNAWPLNMRCCMLPQEDKCWLSR